MQSVENTHHGEDYRSHSCIKHVKPQNLQQKTIITTSIQIDAVHFQETFLYI